MVDEFDDDGDAVPWDAVRAPGADAAPPDDPIVAEVRAVREALFAEAGYDLDEFVRRVRAAQARRPSRFPVWGILSREATLHRDCRRLSPSARPAGVAGAAV